MFLGVMEPWTPSRMSVFLGKEKWRHFHTCCCEMDSAPVCEGAELSVGSAHLRGCQVLCSFGLSLGPLASGRLDPTFASFYSLTLVITP